MKFLCHDFDIIDFLVNNMNIRSKTEARRLIEQGGVKVIMKSGGIKIKEGMYIELDEGGSMVLKIGKRRFVKVIFEE